MVQSILKVPAPILREPTTQVPDPTAAEVTTLIRDLRDTCIAASGVGLAAPQIGASHRVCVINYPQGKPLGPLINPEVIWTSEGTSVLEEGCLSIPDVIVPVPRPKKVRVKALNEAGESVEIQGGDFLAKIIQHEMDHLNGILITDYAAGRKATEAEGSS